MNIGKLAAWAIRQALGKKRGEAVLALLSGPIGMILDRAILGGRAQTELSKIEADARRVLASLSEILR